MSIRLIAPGRAAFSANKWQLLSTTAGSTGGGDSGGGAPGSPDTLVLADFYKVTGARGDYQPIVQRKAGTTSADVPVLFSYTGNAPTNIEARVIRASGGAVVKDWTALGGLNATGTTGQGTLPGVPQGEGYLLQIRDGWNPTNAATISNGSTAWGVGVIFLFEGQSNMVMLLGANAFATVAGLSQTEWDYYLAGNVPGSVFDKAGWHAPSNGSNGDTAGSNAGSATGNYLRYLRIVAAALKTKYGITVPVGGVGWAFNANSIEAFLPPSGGHYLDLIKATGTKLGTIGFASPGNYYAGDFEGVFWHQGEANAANTPASYVTKLQTLYQGYLDYVAPFGRTAEHLYFGVAVLGNYSPSQEPLIENMRQAELTFVADARAGTLSGQSSPWPLVDVGVNCIDLAIGPDGLHISDEAMQKRGMARMIQGVLKTIGAAQAGPSGNSFGARGPSLDTWTRNGLVVTFNVVHEGGTALTVPNVPNPPTGFYCNTAVDFSGTYIKPSVALVNNNTQIALTFPGGTTFPLYVKYMGGKIGNTVFDSDGYVDSCYPNFSNAIYDNVSYPTGTTGTDVEAMGLPLLPSNGAIQIT